MIAPTLPEGFQTSEFLLEHSTYAILSPEGYSAILWKTEGRAEEAIGSMKLTAQDLAEMGIIDKIIPEYGGATIQTVDRIAAHLQRDILAFLIQRHKSGRIRVL